METILIALFLVGFVALVLGSISVLAHDFGMGWGGPSFCETYGHIYGCSDAEKQQQQNQALRDLEARASLASR